MNDELHFFCTFVPIMRKIYISLLLLAAMTTGSAQNLRQRLDSLLTVDPLTETAQVGVMVWDLTADTLRYARQEHQLLRPASTMKVLTAITALDQLGGDYTFSTSLYYKGTIEGRTLKGDLCCVGGMDPMFDQDDMEALVANVRRLGIDTLRGRILCDTSMKDTLRYGEGWCWDDDNPVLTPLRMGRRLDFGEQFAAALRRGGVVLADAAAVKDGLQSRPNRLPAGATFIVARTHSIDHVMLEMMKESNNLFAESMFYQTALHSGHRPATAKDARKLERDVMLRAGLLPQQYRIADGSGLSLYNYLSAEAITMLLRYAWFDNRIYSHLLPTLPVAGQDGTLKKRFVGTPAESNVQAKTGTLTGITSLAGYCTSADGHRLCFAVIVQGVMRAADGREFIDKLCVELCQ